MSNDDGMATYWPSELMTLKYILQNRPAQVIKRGWPDFGIRYLDDESYEFIESKSYGKNLTIVQIQCSNFLRKAGLEVKTWNESLGEKKSRIYNGKQIERLPNFSEFNTKKENYIDFHK